VEPKSFMEKTKIVIDELKKRYGEKNANILIAFLFENHSLTSFVKNFDKEHFKGKRIINGISNSFYWEDTPRGDDYWRNLNDKWQSYCEGNNITDEEKIGEINGHDVIVDESPEIKGTISFSFIPMPDIKRIVNNDPYTIVFWSDGEKTVIKRKKGERNDIENAIVWAYFYKNSGLSKVKAKRFLADIVEGAK